MLPSNRSQISLPPGYEPKRFIASGAYGSVFLLERPDSSGESSQFAVKVIADYKRENMMASPKIKREYLKRMAREINLCRHFQGCYEFIGYEAMYRSPSDSNLYIIMNYASHNLREVTLETRLEERIVRFLTAQILSGLQKMHSRRCSHRDLSSRNILVDIEHAFAYICDFGLSRAHINSDAKLTVEVVTLPYRAPELLMQCREYDCSKVDIWSVGILVIEMMLRSPPVSQKDVLKQLVGLFSDLIPYDHSYWISRVPGNARKFLNDYREKMEQRSNQRKIIDVMGEGPNPLSPAGIEVLRVMLSAKPEDRKSCEELLGMAWFQEDEACAQQIKAMAEEVGEPDEHLRHELEVDTDVSDADAINVYLNYIDEAVPLLENPSVYPAPPMEEDFSTP